MNAKKIPNDLVIIPDIEGLSQGEIILVDMADWYEADKIILVSAKAINYLSEDDPLDAGIVLKNCEICYIDGILHRYNEEDGFYHA